MEKGARAVTSRNPLLHAPASCRVPGAPGSFGSVRWGRLLGASRGTSASSTSGLPPSPGLQDRTLSLVPRRASPPPRHPEPPCALHTGSFRLGSPRSPCHPLGSPRSSALPTHTPPLRRGSTSGLSSCQIVFVFKGSPAPFSWVARPLDPSLFLIRREQCPDLRAGSLAGLLVSV